jgi:hypothetical protein
LPGVQQSPECYPENALLASTVPAIRPASPNNYHERKYGMHFIARQCDHKHTQRLAARLSAGMIALALLFGGVASQAAPFAAGSAATAGASARAIGLEIQPCL